MNAKALKNYVQTEVKDTFSSAKLVAMLPWFTSVTIHVKHIWGHNSGCYECEHVRQSVQQHANGTGSISLPSARRPFTTFVTHITHLLQHRVWNNQKRCTGTMAGTTAGPIQHSTMLMLKQYAVGDVGFWMSSLVLATDATVRERRQNVS